jgi:hypothetical protein
MSRRDSLAVFSSVVPIFEYVFMILAVCACSSKLNMRIDKFVCYQQSPLMCSISHLDNSLLLFNNLLHS